MERLEPGVRPHLAALGAVAAAVLFLAPPSPAQQWSGLSGPTESLELWLVDFGAQGGGNTSYYDGDFGDFDGDGRPDRALGARFGLLWNAGGGFMVVPALTLLGGLSMRHAIGTSLMVIAMKSFAAFAGYAGHVDIDWNMVMIFVLASLVGTVLGAWSAKRIDAAHLRTGFAWFVLVMGVFIVLQKSGIVQLDKRPAAPQVQTNGAAEGPKAHASSALPLAAQPG